MDDVVIFVEYTCTCGPIVKHVQLTTYPALFSAMALSWSPPIMGCGGLAAALKASKAPALRSCIGWVIGYGQVRAESTGVASSNYEAVIPTFLRRRRSLHLALKEKKLLRKVVLSQQALRRRQEILMKHLRAEKERIIERENIWTIPNILCVGRIIVCPYLGYLIVLQDYGYACCLLAVAGITDFLDGFIARNFNQTSKLGSFLDPLADKVLVATVFSTLTYNGIMPLLLTSVIVARDVMLAAAGFYVRYKSLPPPKTLARYFDPSHATAQLAPTTISKYNTFVQLGAICCTLSAPVSGFLDHPYLLYLWQVAFMLHTYFGRRQKLDENWGESVRWFTGATTVLSAGSYIFSSNTYKILKDANKGTKVYHEELMVNISMCDSIIDVRSSWE